MKQLKNYNLVVGILFAYTTGMYIYFFPQNEDMGSLEKWLIVAVSYIVLIILWFLLRRRNQLKKEREDDLK